MLILILFLTTFSILIDLPSDIPVKFQIGPVKINRITKTTDLKIPFWQFERKHSLDGGAWLAENA